MVQKTVLDQFFDQEEIALLTDILIPQPGRPETYDTAYGIFLGYKLGLNPDGRGDDFEALAEKKMLLDIKEHVGDIAQKIAEILGAVSKTQRLCALHTDSRTDFTAFEGNGISAFCIGNAGGRTA